jgi:uncharacterized cupredoxin-like copper-binding protein
MHRNTTLLLFAFLTAALLLANCGPGAPPELQVDLDARDIEWNITTIETKVGQKVTIRLENVGALDHNLVIEDFGIDTEVSPGDIQVISFIVDAAGNYDFICDIPGHAEAGMVGQIVASE